MAGAKKVEEALANIKDAEKRWICNSVFQNFLWFIDIVAFLK